MARPTGSHSTDPGPRKQLIQPALPALPRITKAKKEPIKGKEEDNGVVNGNTIDQQVVVQPEIEPQSITPIIEDSASVAGVASPISPSLTATVPDDTQVNEVEALSQETPSKENKLEEAVPLLFQDEIVPNENSVNDTVTFANDANDAPEARGLVPVTILSGESDTESDEWEPTSTRLPRNPQNLPREAFEPEYMRPKKVNGASETDFAPEAVTGNVEIPLLPHHAARPSVSNSSLQHTPKSGIAVLVSPESSKTHRQQDSINSRADTAPEVLVNGHITPARSSAGPTGVVVSPVVKPSFPTILDHFRGMQHTQEWNDCEICVYYPYASKPLIYRQAHSLILIRSERMRNFIYPQRVNNYSYYMINLYPARNIDVNAFDAAIRFLYADTVLHAERLFRPEMVSTKPGKISALDYVMSYMVAGLELGVEPVVTRSLDLVGRLLDWDLAELAVREAASLRLASAPTVNPNSPPDAIFAAKLVLEHVFNLLVLNLDVTSFILDTIAHCHEMASRLAHFEGRAAVNPALANMVFGSMPASSNFSPASPHAFPAQSAPSPDTIASVIMLNMDYEDLFGLASALKKVHGELGMRIIADVVEERERRRLNIVNNRSVSNKQRVANSNIWEVVAWREYVSDNNLRRERIGFIHTNKRGGNN